MDIAGQLEVRQAEAELATALEAGADAATLRPLVGVYFRRCLRWEERHGYYGVLRVGRLNSLFPRPPIPRDAIRTWPPFVPYAISLRRALLAAGDPRGDRFFEHIQRELEPEFGSEKVRRGCIDAMRAMMDRDEAK